MKRKITAFALSAMLLALRFSAEAQQAKKIPRLGFLGQSSSAEMPRVEALRQGLHDLGHVEGKNIAIEYRYADQDPTSFVRWLMSWSV